MNSSFQKEVKIVNKRGLHARAAAKFVKLVESLGAEVNVLKDGLSVIGTSIMGLLTLSASMGTSITIVTNEEKILNKLTSLVENGFNES